MSACLTSLSLVKLICHLRSLTQTISGIPEKEVVFKLTLVKIKSSYYRSQIWVLEVAARFVTKVNV